jgi:hypothetical protein
MYLLKLRHGDGFCTMAGSSWRLIFVFVLMPWLSKYRALRRAALGVEKDDGASIMLAPLRAVSLVDARGYALRAASLMPAASGFIGGSSVGFGGRTDRDELRVLQAENRRLLMQLRALEREALKEDDDGTIYVPPPRIDHSSPYYRAESPDPENGQPSPEMTRDSESVRFADERTPHPPPPALRRESSAGLTGLLMGQSLPPLPAWKRDQSAEL